MKVKDVRVTGTWVAHMYRYTSVQVEREEGKDVRVPGTWGVHMYRYTSVQVERVEVRVPGTWGEHMYRYTSVQVERVEVKDARVPITRGRTHVHCTGSPV